MSKENEIEPKDTFAPSIGNGITIRQYYAGLAMQGLIAHYGMGIKHLPQNGIEHWAVLHADMLINELNKPS